jgi:hypothetical protein
MQSISSIVTIAPAGDGIPERLSTPLLPFGSGNADAAPASDEKSTASDTRSGSTGLAR